MRTSYCLIAFLFSFFLAGCKDENGKEMFIVSNQLNKIPDSVFLQQHLSTLSISIEGYTLYPPLSGLGSSDFPVMPLAELPERFCELQALKTLKIIGSRLKKLPTCFTALKNIETLDLSLNSGLKPVNEMDKFKALPRLKTLNIFGSDLTAEDEQTIRKTLPGVKIIANLQEALRENP